MRSASVRRGLVLGAVLALLVPPVALDAIPAFARKYKVSCALCHHPFPRLNEFGETFAGNGFRFAIGEPARDTVNAGDNLLRLQSAIPLAMRIDAYMGAVANGDGKVVATDLQSPYGIKLFSGGQITDDISYYLYFFMSERGEVAGLEDAFVQFTDVAGSGVTAMVGQFQVSDPLFKRELRLEYEDYALYRLRMGDARADLTYDRGVMLTYSPREGTDLAFEVVNGTGLDEAESNRRYDRDQGKNVMARLSQDLDFVRVGGFVYAGRERSEGIADDMLYWGLDATLPVGDRTEVNFQYLNRTDDNPFFLEVCALNDPRCDGAAADPFEATAEGIMGELLFSPGGSMGRWHLFGIYNRVWSDRPVVTVRLGEGGDGGSSLTNDAGRPLVEEWETVGAGATWLAARNFRFMGELLHDLTQEQTRLVVGLVTAF